MICEVTAMKNILFPVFSLWLTLNLFADTVPPVKDFKSRISYDINRSYSEKNGKLERISLNQYWKFLPCERQDTALPQEEEFKGYFLVPGYWRSSGLGNVMRDKDGNAMMNFKGKAVTEYPAAWYYRTVNIPRSMKDTMYR